MDDLVSILIPVYNSASFLAETIRSAQNQSWSNLEIIIVDDGSTDDSLAIAQSFSCAQIKVHSQANQGAAAARNKAMSLAQGQWLQWLDGDDLISPNKIFAQIDRFRATGYPDQLLSSAWGSFYYRPRAAQFNPSPLWQDLAPADWLRYKLDCNVYMQTATWLTSRSLAEKIGPWNEVMKVDDDGEYFCRAISHCSSIAFVPEAKVYYRKLGGTSLSTIGASNDKRQAQWQSMQIHMQHLRRLEDSARTREACCKYVQLSMSIFYPESPKIVAEAASCLHEMGFELELKSRSSRFGIAQKLFGHRFAESIRHSIWSLRKTAARKWDHLLFQLGR